MKPCIPASSGELDGVDLGAAIGVDLGAAIGVDLGAEVRELDGVDLGAAIGVDLGAEVRELDGVDLGAEVHELDGGDRRRPGRRSPRAGRPGDAARELDAVTTPTDADCRLYTGLEPSRASQRCEPW